MTKLIQYENLTNFSLVLDLTKKPAIYFVLRIKMTGFYMKCNTLD